MPTPRWRNETDRAQIAGVRAGSVGDDDGSALHLAGVQHISRVEGGG